MVTVNGSIKKPRLMLMLLKAIQSNKSILIESCAFTPLNNVTEQIKEPKMANAAIHPVTDFGRNFPNKPLIRKPIRGNNGTNKAGVTNNVSCIMLSFMCALLFLC